MIVDYITRIGCTLSEKYDGTKEFIFYGDGFGDFEQMTNFVYDKQILLDYIEYCNRQIELVNDYIKTQT